MAYDSPYGTGDRRASITVSNTVNVCIYYDINYFVNGVIAGDNSLWLYSEDITGKYLRFQFPEAIIVDHIKWYQSGNSTHGTWKIQGSNDGSSWTDIGSSFTLGGSTAQEIDISANTTAYTYYQFIGVTGVPYPNDWILEVEFSWAYPAVSSDIKSVNGVAYADIKSVDGVAVAGIKKIN